MILKKMVDVGIMVPPKITKFKINAWNPYKTCAHIWVE